jgi:RNA polymerase sigma factor (sigma-70 family)
MCEQIFLAAYSLACRAAAARSAAAAAGGVILAADREDMTQEAVVAVWQALPSYDASRSCLRTFVELIIASRFASSLRSRRRQLTFETLQDHQTPVAPDRIQAMELRMDIERTAASLADRDRDLAELLMDCGPTEASRAMRCSRAKVYAGINRIRTVFAQAGLGLS